MSIFKKKGPKVKNFSKYLSEEFDLEDVKHKICVICKTKNDENAAYCSKCSTNLQDIVCPICETTNKFDQHYCKTCNSILQNKKRR